MRANPKRVNAKLSVLVVFVLIGITSVFADVTYMLIDPGSWPVDIQNQISASVAEAVALYNQYGSFNKQLYIRYSTWPGVTAEANFNGDMTFGSLRSTRVALHEMTHVMGCGTINEWGSLMGSGTWAGVYGTNKLREFDGGDAFLHGDKWHFWPYGLNYDNEDGTVARIRSVKLVAALVADMGFLSFINEPVSQTLQSGDAAVFTATAVNFDGYAWYKEGNSTPLANGGDISGANSNTLRIANVEADDEGVYYCVALRAGTTPQASRRARLNVRRLVSHWRFSGNAYDGVGPNHGTVTGSPVYTMGKTGQAIDLNGTSDYVTLPAGVANSDDITVAAWVYWDGGDVWQRIFDFGNNTGQFMVLMPRSGDNTLRFAIKNGGGEQIVETTQLATGQWVHLAVTLSGDTAALYVNGASISQAGGITINPGDFAPRVNYIGKSQFADPLFNGRIDEFRVYSYALTSTEIQTLYAGLPGSPSPAANTTGVRRQLSLAWGGGISGEKAWQAYLATSQAAILNATPASAEYLGVRYQEQLSTPMLQANTSYYWRVDPVLPDGSVLKGRIWIFTTGATAGQLTPKFTSYLIGKPDAVERVAYNQSLAGDVVMAGECSFQKLTGPEWIGISSSGQIAGTPPEGAAGQTSCTVRITNAAGYADEAAVVLSILDTCSGMKGVVDLGRFAEQWLYAGDVFSPADLDQNQNVDLADWSLFAADWNYDSDPGLVAAWTMDEAFGATIGDEAGCCPAILQNMNMLWRPVETILGKTSPCLAFDGVNDYVEVPGYKGIVGGSARTVSAWVKTPGKGANIVLLSWGVNVPGQQYLFGIFADGGIGIYAGGPLIKTTQGVANDQWRHVAAVLPDSGWPSVGQIRLYIDGVRQTNVTLTSDDPINTAAAGNFLIGSFEISAGQRSSYFKGFIDEVRVYDRALSDEDIAEQARRSGLAAYWPLDDGSGTIAAEAISGFDGALVNMGDGNWTAGSHMTALNFNGTDEYIVASGYKGISGTASRTCTAWVKTAGTAGTDQVIVSWGSSVAGGRWMFRLQASGEPAVAVGGGYVMGTLPVTDNQWHHVVAVLNSDGTPSVDEIVFYVDGAVQSTTAANAYPINTSNVEPVYIGKLNSATFPSCFKGSLDEVRIYDRALIAAEIASLTY